MRPTFVERVVSRCVAFAGALSCNHPARSSLNAVLIAAVMSLVACGTNESTAPTAQMPALETKADSVAYRMMKAHGGFDAWPAARFLRFDFAVDAGGSTRTIARHAWDRSTGNYRVEWTQGADTAVVVLMNVNDRRGRAFINQHGADPALSARLVDAAYERHINDTYWLIVPMKVFDEGVVREIAADSSSDEVDVLALSFENVGLTPGDRYWLSVRKSDGMIEKWAYHLQGWGDRRASVDMWMAYREMETPAGVVRLAERKERAGGRAMLMHNVRLPAQLPTELFTDPARSLD